MNIKKIYSLDDVSELAYAMPVWCNHDAFWSLVSTELDDHNFHYSDATDDERVKAHLKAAAEVHNESYSIVTLEYIAISYDRTYVALVIGVDRPFGWDTEEMYVTNYPKFQAMCAYIKAMYQSKPSHIIGETTKIDDLDGRFGFVIDKRFSTNMRKEDA